MNVFEECIRKVSMKQANLQPDLVTSDIEFWLNKHVVFGLIVAVPLVLWLEHHMFICCIHNGGRTYLEKFSFKNNNKI